MEMVADPVTSLVSGSTVGRCTTGNCLCRRLFYSGGCEGDERSAVVAGIGCLRLGSSGLVARARLTAIVTGTPLFQPRSQDLVLFNLFKTQVYPEEQQCSCTCLHQMRPDKTPQEYQVYPEEQQCSCTCLHKMRPDKTPQVTGVSAQQQNVYQVPDISVHPNARNGCERNFRLPSQNLRARDIHPYPEVYPEEQQCSCTCLHQMRPDKIPQDTGVSDETRQDTTGYRSIRAAVQLYLSPPDETRQDTTGYRSIRCGPGDQTKAEEKTDFYRPSCVKEDGEV
ncbi:hypothetical protein Bbelb_153420 [Branchiostoma belcheri]|nr:hypothetical protein Bbelb_153420 [Branchiostoma belcheri]